MHEQYLWYALFVVLTLVYVTILYKVKNRRKYLAYFVSGAVVGFILDFVGVGQAYYAYFPFAGPILFGIPLSVTIAEGLSVAITIYLFELLKKWL